MIEKRKIVQVAEPYFDEREWEAIKEPIKSGWVTQGPKVAEFEQAFAQEHGVKHGIATTSCTTALHLALLAIGVGPGDAVIVPSFTWVATANAVEYCGATPIFCDIDPKTYNIDPLSVRRVLVNAKQNGFNVKAIIAVHLFGLCAEMDEILALAKEYDLKVVEDAACAAGSAYKGQPAGSIGDIGCFSFHPRKVMVTGEGGMCTTSDDSIAACIHSLRSHGASQSEQQLQEPGVPYWMSDYNILGYNYRMTDIQATIGLVQLSRLDQFINERSKWADFYRQELSNIEWLQLPIDRPYMKNSWQAYICQLKPEISPVSRDALLKQLFEAGISSRVGTQAVHILGYYKRKYGIKDTDLPNAYNAYCNSIALPLHNRMNNEDYEKIIKTLLSI